MSKEESVQVKVPYVLNDPLSVAEKELQQAGLGWTLFGDVRVPSYVKSTTPAPGHLVAKGTKIELLCVHGPTP